MSVDSDARITDRLALIFVELFGGKRYGEIGPKTANALEGWPPGVFRAEPGRRARRPLAAGREVASAPLPRWPVPETYCLFSLSIFRLSPWGPWYGLHSGAADKTADKIGESDGGDTTKVGPSADKTADKNDPDDSV